jgi:hypothetical protein
MQVPPARLRHARQAAVEANTRARADRLPALPVCPALPCAAVCDRRALLPPTAQRDFVRDPMFGYGATGRVELRPESRIARVC